MYLYLFILYLSLAIDMYSRITLSQHLWNFFSDFFYAYGFFASVCRVCTGTSEGQ